MIKEIFVSIKRRRKEVRYVSIVTIAAVFFMAGILLVQYFLNQFILERNYQYYGEWILASKDEQLSHPYLVREGCGLLSAELVDEDKKPMQIWIGAIDEELIDIGNINLYEGEFPKAGNEAVMDTMTLSRLGYSYDLGQEIELSYQIIIDGIPSGIETKTYKLTGVVRNFADVWTSGNGKNLPNILVSEKEAESFPSYTEIHFYQLNRMYQDMNTLEFAEVFLCDTVWYNHLVYARQLWTSSEGFVYISYVMILIAVLAIGYLLSSYTSKRRKTYYRYRCMGVSMRELQAAIVAECLYAALPAALLGIAAAYFCSFAVCQLISLYQGLPSFFEIDVLLLLRQAAGVAIVLILSIGWTVIRVNDKKLVQNTGEINPKKLGMLRQIAKRAKYPEREILKRSSRIHRFSGYLSVMVSVLSCGFLILCVNTIYDCCRWDVPVYTQEMSKFTMSKKIEYTHYFNSGDGNEGWEDVYYKDMFDGIDAQALSALEDVSGVKYIETQITDGSHYLDWENKKESEVLQHKLNEGWKGCELNLGVSIRYDVGETDLRELTRVLGIADDVDWELWKDGEAVIVVWRTMYNERGSDHLKEIFDTSIENGETLALCRFDTDIRVPVIVTGLGYEPLVTPGILRLLTGWTMTVFGSEQLVRRLEDACGLQMEANGVTGYFDQLASYEATDKQLARFAAERKLDYSACDMESRNRQLEIIIRTLCIYGALGLMIVVIYLVLQKNFSDSRNYDRIERYRMFKRLGMEDGLYLRQVFAGAVREFVWLFMGIPAAMTFQWFIKWQKYAAEFSSGSASVSSILLNDMTENTMLLAFEDVIFYTQHYTAAAAAAVLFIFMVWWEYRMTRRYMRSI